MDENKPPEEPTPAPIPEPTPEPQAAAPAPAPTPQPSAGFIPPNAQSGGPVPFAGPPDSSIPQEERTQALLTWVLMFVIGFVSPLVFFFVAKDKPFVKHHAATGLTMVIVGIGLGVVMFILAFILALAGPLALLVFPLWGLISLCFLAIIIMGAISGNAGSRFDPPLIGKLRDSIFKA